MAASDGTCSPELYKELLNVADICSRIKQRISRPAPPDSPLIELGNARIRKLITAVEDFSKQITDPDEDLQNSSTHAYRLLVVKDLLCEALYLLELCTNQRVDSHGDDGAINAMYASMFLVMGPHFVGRSETVSDRVKRLRMTDELARILSSCFGGRAMSPNYWWGLPSDPHPPSSIAFELRQKLATFANNYIDTFHPRYVHSYSTSDATPYIADKSTVAASGSFGTVRKVFHKTTGECFAAKSFHSVLSKRDRQKILRELGCLELCVHSNLITLVEAFEVKDDPHTITIVMAPWAPRTLWDFLLATDVRRKAEFSWFEPGVLSSSFFIYCIMFDIAAAIAFLHSRSIKHKDIKPQNILLYRETTGNIRPIVTDVGETKVYRAGAATEPKKSSYEYLAPEQQLETEEMQSSLKSDIWQLGCCFALLLAVARSGSLGLRKLWNSFTNTAENSSCNIANESVQFKATLHDICTPGSISQKHAHWVVTRMLDKSPTTRFDIEDVSAELEILNEMVGFIVQTSIEV